MFNLRNQNNQSGIVKFIFLIVIGIIILSYFGFNIRAIVESPETQGNLGYVWGLTSSAWNTYLAKPASYLWNDIFLNILWKGFVNNMEKIKAGKNTDLEDMALKTIVK